MYNLKKRLYTVSINTKERTVINTAPNSVTAHNGIESKNPTFDNAFVTSSGIIVSVDVPKLTVVMTLVIMPCTILKIATIKSIPYVTNILAIANLRKSRNISSGLFSSLTLVHVLTNPNTKNKTSNAIPIANNAP